MNETIPLVPWFPDRPIDTASKELSGENSTSLTLSPPPTPTLIEPYKLVIVAASKI